MSDVIPAIPPGSRWSSRFLPLLMLLFMGSGCAALIYEIVWFQVLELVIGSSAVSIGVLLGTFMGGMCLGSLLFSRLVSRKRHPLRIYALLELAIGVVALAVTVLIPVLDHFYISMAAPGGAAIGLRAIICAVCLLPPTILMGATLPAISRWIETTPRGISWLGFFYGGNTAGAVIGSLLAGFYLLRQYDMSTATLVAVTINIVVGLMGMGLSFAPSSTLASSAASSQPLLAAPALVAAPGMPIYFAIALSGMSALGAEVVWTRLLSLLLGGTTYTFSIILGVFLAGLGIGSSIGAMLSRGWSGKTARVALGWCQLLCALGIAWTAYAVTNGLPNWPVNPFIATSLIYSFELDLARCLWGILPPTLFWGASFPLALAAVVAPGRDPAKAVGRVYAANTVGAIAGALLFSLVFIPRVGTQQSEHILIALVGISAIIALLPSLVPSANLAGSPSPLTILAMLLIAITLPAGSIAFLQINHLDSVPWKLVAFGRRFRAWDRDEPNNYYANPLYVGEGMNSSVAVTELEDGIRRFHVSGKVEASSLPEDMRLQLMLGHFPALFHPHPKKVLIVGCGAGVTAGSFIVHPDVEKIVICEIEPLIPQVVATYFGPQNNDVVTRETKGDRKGQLVDPRVEIVYDDARHYILTTKEKFDIITSDPIHPWVKGAATLYTREYFELVKAHLNPGGIVTQWVPLYESSESAVKSEIATFFKAFPNGTVWNNDYNGGGYDVVVMGSNGDFKIDEETVQSRFENNMVIATLLGNSGFKNSLDVLSTYAGRASDLESWVKDAQINEDRNLRLQYLAGDSLNAQAATDIIKKILALRTYPKDILTPLPEHKSLLELAWSRP